MPKRPPVLVLSLDFELHWGVRDHVRPGDQYMQTLLGARSAIPKILELFEKYEIAATWASVGLLFSGTREEQTRQQPANKPTYLNPIMDPYQECVGSEESTDPWHFGESLIQKIAQTPRQEIATHTFSHYYCLEPGQSRDQFCADLEAAKAAAKSKNTSFRSIVFPRNQVNADYLPVLAEYGIDCYRGPEENWANRGSLRPSLAKRACRLIDSYLNLTGANSIKWSNLEPQGPPYNLPGSRFVRPVRSLSILNWLQARRLKTAIQVTAKSREIIHLWWHPHNLGSNTSKNLEQLENILICFKVCQNRYGMQSLSMGEVVEMLTTNR